MEESKALAELKITKKKMKSLKQEKKRNLHYKRKRVDELVEEAKEWRESSFVAANITPEVKLGNKAGGRGDPFNDRFEAQIRRQIATGVSVISMSESFPASSRILRAASIACSS